MFFRVIIMHIFLAAVILFHSPLFGATIFGPQKFTRTKGAPNMLTSTFSTNAGRGTMIVLNGKPGRCRRVPYAVRNARIFLNDIEIFGPGDFRKSVHHLSAPVDLDRQNTLRVELKSKPRSFLSIEIIQDISPPVINHFSADPTTILPSEESVLQWDTEDAQSCVIDPGIGAVPSNGSISVSPLETTTYTLTAANMGGTTRETTTVTVASFPPEATLNASPAFISRGESAVLTWTATNAQQAFIDQNIGGVPLNGSITVTPHSSSVYRLSATGPSGSVAVEAKVTVLGEPEPLPENSFGGHYQDLIPQDATIDAYDSERFAVITGSISDINTGPLDDVTVTVHGHPEYGTAITDADGTYSIPVEGGGMMTLVFKKSGYITTHRRTHVSWNDIAVIDPFQMIEEDPASTLVMFNGDPDTIKTHRSSPVTDEFSSRACTLVFQGDNRAYATDENGNDMFELSTINVRATEFATQDSMPAVLPPSSAYTYCTELSVDGVKNVRFEKPITIWVDNFLGFNVGEAVPSGYYDRNRAVWIPSDNGIVVKLLDINNDGIVDALDATGDDIADDLNHNGAFFDEVTGLDDAIVYQPGASFWRVPVSHFSPWDHNWPYGPPLDAIDPNPGESPSLYPEVKEELLCKADFNSYVDSRNQIFHEDIPIPGTDITLHYASNRVKDNKTTIRIPVSGDQVPASLKRIIVKVSVAGKNYEKILDPLPNQKIEIPWDWKDFRGEFYNGSTRARLNIGFVYGASYYSAGDFEQAFSKTGNSITAIKARQEIITWRKSSLTLTGQGMAANQISDGWTISNQHYLDPINYMTLFKGDGSEQTLSTGIIETVSGNGFLQGEGPADKLDLSTPWGLDKDAEGNIYIAEKGGYRILKLDRNNDITIVAGNGTSNFSGDGGLATDAQLSQCSDVAVDDAGNIYIADTRNHRIRKVDTKGIISTIAGNGIAGFSGDGGLATEAQLNWPWAVEVDSFGNVLIGDARNGKIRTVDQNGMITTLIDFMGWMSDLEADKDGNIYIASESSDQIFRIDAITGELDHVAGTGIQGYSGDGGPATSAMLYEPEGLAIDDFGNIYIADKEFSIIRKIDSNGLIITIAGNGTSGYSGDGGQATKAQLRFPNDILADHSGNLIISEYWNEIIRKVGSSFLLQEEIVFPEENGLGHMMSPSGRHERTFDLETGATLKTFNYNEENQIVSITDQFNNVTLIQRDSDGTPTAIVSPDGITTALMINEDNHLTDIIYPDGSSYHFEYTSGGLMKLEVDPNLNRFSHVFDDNGRLTDAYDEEGGHFNYQKTTDANGNVITTMTTGEGNQTIYKDHTCSTGKFTSTITGSDGSVTEFERSADGLSAYKSLPCGMDLQLEYDVDKAFKTKILKQTIESTPSGLTRVTLRDKAYTDGSGDNNFEKITQTLTVNNKTAVLNHDVLQSRKIFITPENRTTTIHYDPQNLLTTSFSVPGLFDTSYEYNDQGKLTGIWTNTLHTAFTYNNEGFLETVTDPENNTTIYAHDPMGRVTFVQRPDATGLYFDYDDNGNMTILTNPSNIDHGFGYNKVNLKDVFETPLSGLYRYEYDKDRRLIRTRFPSDKAIEWNYSDPVDGNKSKLMKIITPEGDIDYTYLCGSKVESVTKGNESVTYGYDGKLVTSEILSGTLNQTLGYTYNNDFDVTGFTYAGNTESYSYDLDGLLTGAGGFSVTRNAENGFPEAVSGGALSLMRSLNGYGKITGQQANINSQNAFQWNLIRNNNGRITRKTETIGGVKSVYDYDYDPMGRLEIVFKDGIPVEEYHYNLNGSREYEINSLRGIAGRSFTYSDEDHLMNADGVIFQHDLDGFLSSKTNGADITRYTYSSRGELLNVTLPDTTIIEYIRDPMGRRIAKKVNGTIIEKYLWQDLTRLLGVYDGSDNLLMRFKYADSRMPVALEKEGVTYYPIYDQVGSLRLIADDAGNVVRRIDYDSFGNIIFDTNPDFSVPFGFAGGLHDKDTGLVRFGYRDYDPDTGRWTAKDPIFFAGGDTNLYGYCLNDPVNLVDSTGEFAITGSVALSFFAGKAIAIGSAWAGLQIATHLIENPTLPSDNPCEDYKLSNFMNHATGGIAIFNAGLGVGIAGFELGTTALSNPLFALNAVDAVKGALQQGPPPTSPGGYAGFFGRTAFDKITE